MSAASETAERPAPVVPAKLAHFVLRTKQYRELVDWWLEVLQARVVFANDVLTFLTYDDEHHRMAIASAPQLEERPLNSVGVDHVAFTYAELEGLVHTYERLKARDIRPYWCVNHGPTTSMYYRDPDGNQVELQIDNFATEDELKGFFRQGAFAKNPIGVRFDPDTLAARFHEGVPVAELVRQGSA